MQTVKFNLNMLYILIREFLEKVKLFQKVCPVEKDQLINWLIDFTVCQPI